LLKSNPPRNLLLAFIFLLIFVNACRHSSDQTTLTATASVGPTGSLTVNGRCNAPEGSLLMVRALGAPDKGSQVEQAMLTPVRQGEFFADLGLFDTLSYRISVSLSPSWNTEGRLPAPPPKVGDPQLKIADHGGVWEVRLETTARLGSPADETQLLSRHWKQLDETLASLERDVESLRGLEKKTGRGEIARWFRLHQDHRRDTLLAADGIDPFFPAVHAELKDADEALLKRFHAILSGLTGADDEAGKLSENWNALDQHLAKARRLITDISESIKEDPNSAKNEKHD